MLRTVRLSTLYAIPARIITRIAARGDEDVGLWVSPLEKGSSEGLPAALASPRKILCTAHFWMYTEDPVYAVSPARCIT